MKESSTARTNLITGSLYQKENAEFVHKITMLAEDVYISLSEDQSLKGKTIRTKAQQLFDNLLELTMAVSGRRDEKIIMNRKRLAVEDDGWIFDDDKHLDSMALQDIAREDLIQAYSLWPKVQSY